MNALGLFVRASGRSWWQARYRGGEVVSEWDTLPGMKTGLLLPGPMRRNAWRSRWEELDKAGMVGIRLLCPNGQAGELEAQRDHALFQFKVATATLGAGQSIGAHVIGAIEDDSGTCRCFAWEPPGRLVEFTDDVRWFRYQQVGPLGIENLGLKV
jgi:hypothetical protein